MKKFESNFCESAEELSTLGKRCRDRVSVKKRRKRLETIRKFSNGLDTMSRAEAEELGRTEITNHLTSYRNLQQQELQFASMATSTNSLVEITVDTDNAEQDSVTSVRVSEIFNKGVFNHKGRFSNFWKKVCGEILIAGGSPCLMPQKYGWLPELRTSMYFPQDTDLDADKIPYAFDVVELTYEKLKKFEKVASEDGFINPATVKSLIKAIETQIKENTSLGHESLKEDEDTGSVRGPSIEVRTTSITACWFYEVKYDDDGSDYVSATLYADGLSDILKGVDATDKNKHSQIIAYIDKAYESVNDWLHAVAIDSEIGGEKTWDTLRGIAELVYPSSVEIEELLNLMLEGDKIRSKPKFILTGKANPDHIAKWNVSADMYAPEGVEEMEFRNSTNQLQTPLGIFSQNVAGLSAAPYSNTGRGQELRQQALDRQRNNTVSQDQRLTMAYDHLDCILESAVYRILTMPAKPGCEGYQDVMWVRSQLEKYNIDYKALAKKEHGRFVYIKVKANRAVTGGGRSQAVDSAIIMMDNIMAYPPENRPLILKKFTLAVTEDPDYTDRVVSVPQPIINAQRVTAENEYDTIMRRALLGETIPIGSDDIDQNHIETHMKDMLAHVRLNEIRPWTQLDVIQFQALIEHTGQHVTRLLSNPRTNEEGTMYLQDLQNLVAEAEGISNDVMEREQQQQTGLTPKEEMEMELKREKIRQDWAKIQLAAQNNDRLEQNRSMRAGLAARGQYAREISEDRRLNIGQQQVNIQRRQSRRQ